MLQLCLCCVLFIISLHTPLSALGITHGKTVACYVATYASTRQGRGAFTIGNVDPSLCTHVILAFAHVKNDTSIYVLDSWHKFMGNNSNFASLKRQYPDVKYLASIGGWLDGTRSFSAIAQDEQLRLSFAQNVTKFIRDNGFHGAELCWLYPSKRSGFLSDKQNFVEMLKALKKHLHAQNYLLTAMLGTSYDTIDNGYDLKAISENIDLMNLISYDYNGWWSESIQPNAPMNSSDKWNVKWAIAHMLESGATLEKLLLGIPLYGRLFFATNETMAKRRPVIFGDGFLKEGERRKSFLGPYTQDESGIISYGEICLELLKREKWSRHWDNKSSTPYIVYEDKLISYDDAESTAIKVKFALEQKIRGVMLYGQDLDDFMGDCHEGDSNYQTYPLIRAVNDQLLRYSKEIEATTKSEISHDGIVYCSNFVQNCGSGIDVYGVIVFLGISFSFGVG